MKKPFSGSRYAILSIFIIGLFVLSACAPLSAAAQIGRTLLESSSSTNEPGSVIVEEQPSAQVINQLEFVSETTLQQIYANVNPSVVNIQVLSHVSTSELPFSMPNSNNPLTQSLGSGFVWDKDGHIVTNNHVVEGATEIEVTFWDDRIYPAELVGADPDSDLAVIKINAPESELVPVVMADSDLVLVGDDAIAIGNPYGLEGTMTVGIISAVGRSLSVDNGSLDGNYSIPDIIQTDAAINPGNSGGVLLNSFGQVVGVTTAITSSSNSNSGIGYAVPANIVTNVVPVLIEKGSYAHSWLGISGATLQADIAEAMGLDRETRGILVNTIVPNGPADQGGLRGSDTTFTYKETQISIGGDVITAINDEAITAFDDLVSYLARETQPGQTVTLKIIRDGKSQTLNITLGTRPTTIMQNNPVAENETQSLNPAYLGISGGTLIPEVAEAMGLQTNQNGVLVVEIASDSPAEEAGLIGSSKVATIRNQEIKIGGDIITAIDDETIDSIQTLRSVLNNYQPGDEITLTIMRESKTIKIDLTLAEKP